MLALGRLGKEEDIAFLLPLSDFWKGDRDNHYWIMSALAQLRDRHSYDVNGPRKAAS